NSGSNFSCCGTSACTAATRSGFVDGRFWTLYNPNARSPTRPANVSVRSKCGRTSRVFASKYKRTGVVTAMTFANATTKDKPVTPVNSAIWISGHVLCKETPSPFQPKPPNNQPRIHSCTVHADAARNANSKFRHEARKLRGTMRPTNQPQKAK